MSRVTFGKFIEDSREFAEMGVFWDGRDVGYITRIKWEVFESESSSRRTWKVHSYEVLLFLDAPAEVDYSATFGATPGVTAPQALAAAKDYCRKVLA